MPNPEPLWWSHPGPLFECTGCGGLVTAVVYDINDSNPVCLDCMEGWR